MSDIKKAFPSHLDKIIQKALLHCANYKNPHLWTMKPDFWLPEEDELSSLVSPEECAAYFSAIAAEQRLKVMTTDFLIGAFPRPPPHTYFHILETYAISLC